MMATNHMLAGAVVAVGIQRPLLIAPLAFASHFLLDILPHFGVHHGDSARRNKHPLFQYMIVIDVLLAITLMVMLPSILQGAVSWWVLLLGMVLAFIPDFTWIYHFFYSFWSEKKLELSRLTKFHEKIQWGERPWGVAVELVWFGSMGVLLGVLAT